MRFQTVVCAGLLVAPLLGTAAAQSAAPTPSARFGITLGVNSSTLGGSDAKDAKRRTGIMAGVLLVAPVTPVFAIQPELLYTMKGAKFEDTGVTGTLKMNYIEIPVLARFEMPSSGGVKPFFYVGPSISFKLSCDVTAEFQGQSESASCDDPTIGEANVKSVDYGALVGAGLAFDVSGRAFTLGVRYDHSLAKLSDDSDIKHRVISVVGTLEFPWGK
jgi:hypothetical protein